MNGNIKSNRTIPRTLVWRDDFKENSIKLCKNCGKPLSKKWIKRGWEFCGECNREWSREGNDKFSKEISRDYHETIRSLKVTVSHSRDTKPHKQKWGMHIINPFKNRK